MTDFNKIIEAALAEGRSIEDIAKEMSDALNEASKPKLDPREVYLDELQMLVDDAIDDEEFDLEDSIAVLVLNVVENHPDWSLDAIKAFESSLENHIETTEKMVDCVENDGNIFEMFGNMLTEALEGALGNKSKDEKDCKRGGQCHRSDDETLKHFLRGLGI